VTKDFECATSVSEKLGRDETVEKCCGDSEGESRALNLSVVVLSLSPRVFLIDRFMLDEEADHIISLGATKVSRSTTMNVVSAVRTSSTTWLRREDSDVVDRVYRRAAGILGINRDLLKTNEGEEANAEAMQLVHYAPGQKYDAHYDWGAKYHETRFATLLLYLSDVEEGGETIFPRAEPGPVSVTPKKGSAVLFYNLLPDGNGDQTSLHAAMPVHLGEKWLSNIWIWDPVRGSL